MEQRRTRSFFRALLLFAAGVAIGLLTAPKTGRGARTWLGQKIEHWRSGAFDWTGRLRSQARYQQGRLTGVMHKARQLTLIPGGEEEYVDDDLISQRVRTRIGEHPRTAHLPRVNVDSADRVVTLRGGVQTEEERLALEEVAAADPDVGGVINKVKIVGRRAAG